MWFICYVMRNGAINVVWTVIHLNWFKTVVNWFKLTNISDHNIIIKTLLYYLQEWHLGEMNKFIHLSVNSRNNFKAYFYWCTYKYVCAYRKREKYLCLNSSLLYFSSIYTLIDALIKNTSILSHSTSPVSWRYRLTIKLCQVTIEITTVCDIITHVHFNVAIYPDLTFCSVFLVKLSFFLFFSLVTRKEKKYFMSLILRVIVRYFCFICLIYNNYATLILEVIIVIMVIEILLCNSSVRIMTNVSDCKNCI